MCFQNDSFGSIIINSSISHAVKGLDRFIAKQSLIFFCDKRTHMFLYKDPIVARKIGLTINMTSSKLFELP